ncbi:MAG: DUF1722 domain-containing protein [Aquificota bacterium]|nr:MAG: DUF1722 domain-containing protein [Aquificota bacterium]
MERKFPKPRVVVSSCLVGKPVRYNGGLVEDPFVSSLLGYCDVIDVCPEVEIGLGVPRPRIIVYKTQGAIRLSQPSTGLDLTESMEAFSDRFLSSLPPVDGFVLKSKSPSCGVSNTLTYKDPEGKEFLSKGKGLFAIRVLQRYELLPVEDEGRLKNPEIREHFLVRLFALADLRESLQGVKRVKDLMDFHQRYKYMLMAHSQVKLKHLGRLVAQAREENLEKTLEEYRLIFMQALSRKPSKGQHANALLHILGHLSKHLNEREKRHFIILIERFKRGKESLHTLLELFKSLAYRFENPYLMSQAYLEPFPSGLY